MPRYPHDDNRARELLKGIGLEDRNGNGVVEDARGTEARFTGITQRGIGWYEKGTTVLRDELAGVGIAIDFEPLELGALIQRLLACDYDAIYYRPLATDLDPAGNLDFWLSSGSGAFLESCRSAAAATEWERRIDTLMLEQAASTRPEPASRAVHARAADVRGEPARALLRCAAHVLRATARGCVGLCLRSCDLLCCGMPTA